MSLINLTDYWLLIDINSFNVWTTSIVLWFSSYSKWWKWKVYGIYFWFNQTTIKCNYNDYMLLSVLTTLWMIQLKQAPKGKQECNKSIRYIRKKMAFREKTPDLNPRMLHYVSNAKQMNPSKTSEECSSLEN